MLLRRNVARSQSRVHPCNMVDRHHSDNESVLFEEVQAGSMDEDEQCITAEGKEEEIFIVKMFNRHSNGEKEYNPPMKFHVGKATRLPKDKKTEEQWYQIQYEDNDTEMMNEFELRQHKVTKRRADELRPTEDSSPKELISEPPAASECA